MNQSQDQPVPIKSTKPTYPHDIVDPYHIVSWLFELHYQRGIKPPRPFNRYLKECKKLMKEIPLPEMIDILSNINTERPFGFGIVRSIWEKRQSSKE